MFNLLMMIIIIFVIIYVININIVFASSFVLLVFSYKLDKRHIHIALIVIISSY
jgi:hypothetical protein